MTKLLEMIQKNELTNFPCLGEDCFDYVKGKCAIRDYATCPVIIKMSDEKNLYKKDEDGGRFIGCQFCKNVDDESKCQDCQDCVHCENNNDSNFELQLEYKEE